MISLRNLATSAGVMPDLRSARSKAPGRRAPSSGSRGSWKKKMYQAFRTCGVVSADRRYAAGCGTEIAVRVRTRSGRCIATTQEFAAPRS